MNVMDRPRIAVIGGTGNLGFGIAKRLSAAGHTILIGSRDGAKASIVASEIEGNVTGCSNEAAAEQADIIFVAVPYASHKSTLESIAPYVTGKIVVDTTVPLAPPKVARVHLVPEGSAANRSRVILGDTVKIVSALQNVAASHLRDLGHDIDCDVLVSGDDKQARQMVINLLQDMKIKAWHAGPLDNAVVAEALTSVLIFINKNHHFDGAGIRISGPLSSEPLSS